MKTWWKSELAVAALLILVLASVGYGFLWQRGKILYSAHSDIIAEHLGSKTILYKALREGRGIPFWREDQLSGFSAFTNPQALYTYPLHFLFYLLEPSYAVGGTLWLHFVAAAWMLYLVGAVLGLGRWAKLLMAAAALFNFKLVIAAYAGWLPHIAGITFFPLLFASTFYFVKRPGLQGMLAFGAAGGLCLHTGHLQYFYYATLFLTAYLLWQTVAWWRAGHWQALTKVIAWLLCGVILGTGMAAYLWLPLAGEASFISRSESSYAVFLANHAFTLRHLLTFLHPEALGSPLDGSYMGAELWEDVAYFGLVQFMLAIVGAIWGWRRPHTRFLIVSVLVSLVMAMDSPLLRFLHTTLPGFQLFRCPSRLLFVTAFFGITLAGIGVEETFTRVRKRYQRSWLASLIVGSMLVLVSGEGVFYARRYLTTEPHEQVLPVTAYQGFLASDTSIFRVAPIHRPTINYGWAAQMGLQLITGYDPFNLSHYQAYFDLLQWGTIRSKETRMWTDLTRISRGDLLDALNVKYLVSSWPLAIPSGRFELVEYWKDEPNFVFYSGMSRSDIYLYRNNHFLPRAFWVNELVEAKDETQMIAQMKRQQLGQTAIIYGADQRFFSCGLFPDDRVEVLKASGGHLVVGTSNQTRRFLVVSEVWHPGWSAFIDGRKLRLHRTDLALMGAWIPPGKHRLVLRFRPCYWPAAVGVSAVSAGVFLLLLIIQFRKPGPLGQVRVFGSTMLFLYSIEVTKVS